MANMGFPDGVLEIAAVQSIGRTLDIDVSVIELRKPDDIPPAFATLKNVDGLYFCGDPLVLNNRTRINALALAARLPTMHNLREQVEAGGLMSYGSNFPDLFRCSADMVSKILHGAKPADIPVEQPTKFDLVVNLVTARALGIEVPASLLSLADKVIE